MSKPSLPFSPVAFEFLTNALVLVIIAFQGQGCLPSVSETAENGIASRGALGGILKRRGYGDGTRATGASS
jgi:hypothetical protein